MTRRDLSGSGASSRLASLSASVRRRITWGSVEIIGGVVPQGSLPEQAWHASSADSCVPVKPAPHKAGPSKSPQVQRSEQFKLPTPCRNLRKCDDSQRHAQGEASFQASPVRDSERLRLLERIAELEMRRDSLEAERDEAQRLHGAREELVQKVQEQIECGVCLLPYSWPVSLDCGHSFCRVCVTDWELTQRDLGTMLTCPTCRAPVRTVRPAQALHNVCVAMEDPSSACRRTQEDELYSAIVAERAKDPSLRRMAATAQRRRSSMVFLHNGHEVLG